MTARDVSVVIPIFNEVRNVAEVHRELAHVLDSLHGWRTELIWVDDGSTDGSVEVLRDLVAQDTRSRVIRFRRNFGQTAALAAGFDAARGSVIVTLDADLQNDPADIPNLLRKLEEGYDIVNGWRRKRRDPFFRRVLPSRVANWLISKVTGVRLRDYGCTLKAYRSDVVRNLSLHGELHRFIPALASWYGVDVAEVEVNHRPRLHGSSKYGLGRSLRVLIDLITVKFLLGYGGRPAHVFGLSGFVLGLGGTGLMVVLGVERLFLGVPLGNRPIVLLGILLMVLGLQFIGIGLLAEMTMRVASEASHLKTYVIREVIEGGSPSAL
ncbi:MAG: glycosyltransferase family 2 protein, partial [bacterium]